jgi:hypothetical protein
MSDEDLQLILVNQLLTRLEHLSADSYWSHHASGLRGSLLKTIEQIDTARGENQLVNQQTWRKLDTLISRGYKILENAAREIRGDEMNNEP